MTGRCDVAIVGAGFAGLAAAERLARRGLGVVVLERKQSAGAQIHTTGILVREAAELIDPPPHLVRRVTGVRVYAPSLKSVDLQSPGYYFQTTDTTGLLDWMAERARRAGADIRYGQSVEGADRSGDTVRLLGANVEASYLIGADGARSRVAEAFGLGRNRRFLVGLEVEYRGVAGVDTSRLHTFLDSRIAPGYIGWVAPGVGVTQVGLACKRADKPDLARFIERIRPLFDFDEARVIERRSGVIPCGGLVRPFAGDRVLLVGDAAGMVSPLTAGGIYTALRHGAAVADAVADRLTANGPEPAARAGAAYPRFRFKRLLRRGLDLGPPNWLLNLAIGTRPMQALARLVFFHTKGLGSKAAWRDLVRAERSR